MTTVPARPRTLTPGSFCPLDGESPAEPWSFPAHRLRTHGVVLGMTGSGKTGLLTVMVEEALRARVPVLLLDVKGDLANLGLAFPTHDPSHWEPWIDEEDPALNGEPVRSVAERLASERRAGLEAWRIEDETLAGFRESVALRVLTPGSTAGEPLHILSSLERRSPLWDSDVESARYALSAAVSLLLRVLDRDADPASSREHVLLSVLAERRLVAGRDAGLTELLGDLEVPPIETVGAQRIDAFMGKSERRELASALNALLASPTFASWRTGATMDVGAWLTPGEDGRTPAVVLSVAHLDDEERMLVLGVVLEEVLTWVRAQSGSGALRALVVFDEVYGYLPPHPAKPPTKRPLVALMKQGRAFGVGVLLATQNPMDLDYRSLSNAGLWCVGRLQTDADRARIVEALAPGATRGDGRELAGVVKKLAPRWFVVRDAAGGSSEPFLVQPREAMSWLRGPMTRREVRYLSVIQSTPSAILNP